MIDWFRSWHGAPTDAKWLMIAQRTQTNAGMVSAVVWALFDHASQQKERGDVGSFDPETYAAFSGWDADKIAAIVDALRDKGLIQNNRLAQWEKRQTKREDGSAERAKEWRERKRTQPNANERQIREDKSRDREARKRATRLSDDWTPSSADRDFAKSLGFSDQAIDHHAARFKDFWAAKPGAGGTKLDWSATWRNWMRTEATNLAKVKPKDDWRNPMRAVV